MIHDKQTIQLGLIIREPNRNLTSVNVLRNPWLKCQLETIHNNEKVYLIMRDVNMIHDNQTIQLGLLTREPNSNLTFMVEMPIGNDT